MAFKCTLNDADCGGRCAHINEVLEFMSVVNDEHRLRIICILTNTKGYPVGEICKGVELPQNLVSHHLGVLYRKGLLKRKKVGLNVYYSLNQKKVDEKFSALSKLLNN
ncbi:MAG: hypothetical protein OHK0017_00900 [Patescibacteria group bacterium]